jgi:2-polyprenyl-6-methoxyphenol hydroxylase-like FAD-dependent oxidoreductase
MGERRPIVIVGAGIGGLAAAVALARKGFSVLVVERSAELSEIGAGIQLAPNAGRVLTSLGLDAAIAEVAIEPAAIEVVNGNTGQLLASVPKSAFRSRFGFPYRVIHRADLQAVLVAATAAAGVQFELDTTIEDFAEQSDGLTVHVAKPGGKQTVAAAGMVAADGVWSELRNRIDGAASARPIGRTAWRATVPSNVARTLMPLDRVALWLGRHAHLVHYPIAKGDAVNIVAIIEEDWNRPGWTAPGDATELGAKFAGWAVAARKIVAAPTTWQKFAIAAVDPTRPWRVGRLVLLGDAAHAMPPFLAQGAAMALEDAAVLADALIGNINVPAAFSAYVAERRPRVVAIAAASRRAGDRFHLSSLASLVRNAALRLAGERLIIGQNRPIYRWKPPAPRPNA